MRWEKQILTLAVDFWRLMSALTSKAASNPFFFKLISKSSSALKFVKSVVKKILATRSYSYLDIF